MKSWVKKEDLKLGSNKLYPCTPVPAGTWIRTRRILFWNHLLAFQKSVHARVPPQENLAQVILMSNHCPNKCVWSCCVPGGTARGPSNHFFTELHQDTVAIQPPIQTVQLLQWQKPRNRGGWRGCLGSRVSEQGLEGTGRIVISRVTDWDNSKSKLRSVPGRDSEWYGVAVPPPAQPRKC